MMRRRLCPKSDGNAVVRILVWTIAGYPMLGMLAAYTSAPSLAASIPVRLVVAATSVGLLFRLPLPRVSRWSLLLYVFWAIYVLRLAADLLVGVPETPFDAAFFVLTALLPALAVSRVASSRWKESQIAGQLAVFGLVTASAALITTILPFAQQRSLLEQTGRLSFDTINPITLGHIGVSTLISIGCLIGRRGTKATAWLFGVPLALALLQAAASRGPLVALAAVIFFWIVFAQSGRGRLIAIAGIALIFVCASIFINTESEIFQRFEGIEEDQSSLERLFLQANAIQQFLEKPLTGSAHVELESLTYPHNPIIESAMATGVIGSAIYIAVNIGLLLSIARRLRHGERIVPLLAVQYLVGAQLSGSLFSSSELWVLTAMMLAAPSVAAAPKITFASA